MGGWSTITRSGTGPSVQHGQLPRNDSTSGDSPLKRVAVGFAGADAYGMVERHDENLAVADLAGARRGGDRLDRLGRSIGGHRDLDTYLGQEVHCIFGATIDFSVTLLSPIALDLGDGHSGDADRRQRLPDIVQLERFDD